MLSLRENANNGISIARRDERIVNKSSEGASGLKCAEKGRGRKRETGNRRGGKNVGSREKG